MGSEQKNRRSFDPMASINMLRYDLETFDAVLPETRQRVMDEELTLIAEGINRPLKTEFRLQEVDGQLVYFDSGEWRPYISMLVQGLDTANREAEGEEKLGFMADRASDDLMVGYRLHRLKPGERMHWYSGFPEEQANLYGEAFVSKLGFQPKRKMGFLYCAIKNEDGSLTMQTQSVDNSNMSVFASVMDAAKETDDVVDLREAYDTRLGEIDGAEYFAGRKFNGEVESDAWEIIRKNEDLVVYYLDEIENLAANRLKTVEEVERAKKRLTYGVWAALKERIDSATMPGATVPKIGERDRPVGHNVASEVRIAYRKLANRGEVMSGCGGSIKADDEALMSADPDDVFSMIFGEKPTDAEEDEYGSLTFECPNGHKNTRPKGILIPKCLDCGTSVRC